MLIRFLPGLVALASCLAALQAEPLKVGAARTNITPPNGIPLAGYYSERGSDGVLDDLFAHALVFEKDGTKAAIVTLDLITTTFPMVEEARKLIEAQTGIPAANVTLTASHTHTAPIITGRGPRDAVFGGGKDLTKQYNAGLPGLIAAAVKDAQAHLTAATVGWGVASEKNLAYNRRFFMKDGSLSWNPRKLDPNIVEPAGPIDPEVAVLTINDPKGAALATLVNFALHPDTTGGTKVSADYPGVMSRLVSAARGGDSLTFFANGCCGNINHRDIHWANPQKGPSEAFRIGTVLAGDALLAAKRQSAVADGPLRVLREIVKLPLPVIKPEDASKAADIINQVMTATKKPAFLDQVNAFKIADVEGRKGQPWEVQVQVITLGKDLAIVSLPGEIFVELGLAIKKQSPFKHTIIAELANGAIGYIPDKRSYPQGNYEVVSARCAAGGGEMLVDAALKLLRQAKGAK